MRNKSLSLQGEVLDHRARRIMLSTTRHNKGVFVKIQNNFD